MYGFGISGFRSFGPVPQLIAPLAKVNVFVGQNNVGKSNVLRALQTVTAALLTRNPDALPNGFDAARDPHQLKREARISIYLPVPLEPTELAAYVQSKIPSSHPNHVGLRQTAAQLLNSLPMRGGAAVWFGEHPGRTPHTSPQISHFEVVDRRSSGGDWTLGGVSHTHWLWFLSDLTGQQLQGPLENHIDNCLSRLSPFVDHRITELHVVEAHRRIDMASPYEGLSGKGLVSRIHQLRNPTSTELHQKAKFARIQNFVREVTGCADAELHTAHNASELLVQMNGVLRHIDALGTGIHEVVIFAAAATACDNAIMCMEEPEIHLHPRLQRHLLRYLRDETTNQYFITTHSAHLLDGEGVSVFHVQQNEHGETTVDHVNTRSHRASVCFDLGYRPSDFVQANSIVWVEGPSDRIYVNAWIHALAPELIEGEHYSVMFYGGRLLSHLTVSDEEVGEFIELQRLNRHVAILMDSDKASEAEAIRLTKQRVAKETLDHGGFAWITAGREIENYVPTKHWDACLAAIHPNTTFAKARGQWDCFYKSKNGDRSAADKLSLARAAIAEVDMSVLDLRARVTDLVRFINSANH